MRQAATLAFIINNIGVTFNLRTDRFHVPAAISLPVARINVNVLRPKTFGTMIGIARTLNFMSAMAANKIFNFALEFFGLHNPVSHSERSEESRGSVATRATDPSATPQDDKKIMEVVKIEFSSYI